MPRGRKLPNHFGDTGAPNVAAVERSEVLSFFQKNDCFQCERLRSKLTKQYCVKRQNPKVSTRSAYHPQVKDTPQDAYCRSGLCEQGKRIREEIEGHNNGLQESQSTAPERRLPDGAEAGEGDLPENGAVSPSAAEDD